jgi:heme/copper-type cytochrome/quinol oxidase subunit 3
MFRWFHDILIEACYQGHHTRRVTRGLQYGVLLFIVSEVMFFFSFFFAYFYYSLAPSIWIGGVWPPKGVEAPNPCIGATGSTVALVAGSLYATLSHAALVAGDRRGVIEGLLWALSAGCAFSCFQYQEYVFASFHMNDSVYGSIFYMITGFHGFHAGVGQVFLAVCLFRVCNPRNVTFTRQHHFGFTAAL